MQLIRRPLSLFVAGGLAVLVGCGGHDRTTTSGRQAPPVDVTSPMGLVRWMAAHPQNSGLTVVPDHGRPLVFDASRRFPLASVRKVLIAGAGVEADVLRGSVPRRTVDRFFAPGTDGGSHAKSGLTAKRLPLEKVAQAMIAVSDDAAADALLTRIGGARVDAWARAEGMRAQDPIYPILGELAAWQRDPRWATRSPGDRARTATRLARQVAATDVHPPAIARQRQLADDSVSGTPAEWARLMARTGHRGAPQLVRLLEWPLRQTPKLREQLSAYLEKGGSFPGVVTEASYIRARRGDGAGVAIFLRDLPADVDAQLSRSFTQQKLAVALAVKPGFRAQAARVLAGGR